MNRISPFVLFVLFLIFVSISNCTKAEKQIKVLLDDNLSSYTFINKVELFLFNQNEEKIALIKKNNKIHFIANKNNLIIRIADKELEGQKFYYLSKKDAEFIQYKSKPYRGSIEVIYINGKISIVNQLSIEDYLKGVLPIEMGINDINQAHYEALKAFAITARTFAMNRISNNYYNVKPDINDQVYGGASVEKKIFSDAVDETRGIILYYNNSPAEVFYHSTCGGIIEEAKNVFAKVDAPYLKQKSDGIEPYCSVSPSFNWEEKYPPKEIIEMLNKSEGSDKTLNLLDIEITKRFPSERVEELKITFTNKDSLIIPSKKIRNIFRRKDNGGILRSLNFNILKQYQDSILTKVILTGKGNGHGVGMCQWGALQQSVLGKNYQDILQFYFPGTQLKKYDE